MEIGSEQLGKVLHEHKSAFVDGSGEIDRLQRLSSGASMETWTFDVTGGAVAKRFVLRREPDGRSDDGRGIGLQREAEVMRRARAAGVEVPVIRYEFAPEDGIGKALVMDFVEGEALPSKILRNDRFAAAREGFAAHSGRLLAAIHRIDHAGLGLSCAQPADAIDDLHRRYVRTATRRPVFELAFRWLRDNAPPPVAEPVLVHGDFRNGNLMFGERGVVAVLDWEVAHVGDSVEDLAWLCMPSWRFGQLDKPVGGIGQLPDLLSAYEAASGRRVESARFHFWSVLAVLRWGGMCADMGQWVIDGVDRSLERHVIARRASETELDLLTLLDPSRLEQERRHA